MGVNDLTQLSEGIIIGGLQKSSLIDYPEQICAIVFTQGCNFRCPYCHNPELALQTERTLNSTRSVLNFLQKRIGKLDGVVITGGEPTLQKHLPEFIKLIKGMGFKVKLDTNGTNPEMLKRLINEKLIDYAAMDIKAPIEKYSQVTCTKVNAKDILKSIEILKNSGIDYEFRTTVVKSQLFAEDFEKIAQMIEGCEKYYLQKFVPTKTLDPTFLDKNTYSDKNFVMIIDSLKDYIKQVELR